MATVKNRGTCLYKEARLNIEPAYPGSTISFTVPASSGSTFGLQTRAKRTVVTKSYSAQDDDAFGRQHLASDGSMFFRQHHSYPRSFLWRILDGRKTLEIQAVDLDHDPHHDLEATLTLLLNFTSPIRPFCVAFAEPEDRDALTVFAITTANELYTITLHRDFFIKPVASEQEMADWCKRSSPNLFQQPIPYRLVAVNVNELLVSLENGGIVRLERSSREDAIWDEALYHKNQWSMSLRGILPWKGQQTVRFDNVELAVNAAAAVALAPDNKHMLTVCLDHRIRAWNVASGRLSIERDLLGQAADSSNKAPSYVIAPSQATLMQVVDIPGGVEGASYHLVTYSPKKHQFKFWGVRDADDEQHGIYDAQPHVDLVPPVDELMDVTVWTMEEFHVIPGPAGWRGTELWIRARSGPSSRVYSLKFDLQDEPASLTQVWRTEWMSVDSGPLTVDALRRNPTNPGEQDLDPSEFYESSVTERWLGFLFHPGRFTVATLETALLIFRKGLERSRSSQTSQAGPLKDRICASVVASAARAQGNRPDAGVFDEAVSAQWQAFYGLVKDLHKRRGESLSLAYDYKLDMPWLVLSDYLSAIRSCSDSEVIALNAATVSQSHHLPTPLQRAIPPEFRGVSRLLNAAAYLRRRLPQSLQEELKHQVEFDILQSRPLTVIDRMEIMEGECELKENLTDEHLSILVEELGAPIKHLNTDLFLSALQTLSYEDKSGDRRRNQIARYGLATLVTISQETLEANYNTLLDLLTLVLCMMYEDISDDFDTSVIFVELVDQFKDCLVLTWLARTVWSHPAATGRSSETLLKALGEEFQSSSNLPLTQTVLEGIHGGRAFHPKIPGGLKAGLLTYWSRAWISSVFKEQNYDSVIEDTMGILLAQKEYDLALDFSKFLPEGNWATYLKGRMHLTLGEYTLASICFQKAAHNLALGFFNIDDSDGALLVPEAERNDFSSGLPSYYHHVLGLFERAKTYSFAADFARLGLRSLMGNENEELKTELLQRLFTASLQTARFEEAYSAMTRHSDQALKHSSLQALITAMVSQSQTDALLRFPFVGLQDDVDEILSSLCHKTLNLASGPPYHLILYSFRISRNNFRGAASILYERLQRLKTTSSQVHDPADESLSQCYLMIINVLSSVSKEDAYILAEQRRDDGLPANWAIGKGKKMLKREIVTLETLRKEYQAELDRAAAIESGQFPFVEAGDEMDIL